MNKAVIGIGGTAVGAGLAYMLDPYSGRRRRARVGDQLAHLSSELDTAAGKAARDVRHRATGVYKETASRLRPERADDSKITQRVRAKLGTVCSHPGAIEVTAHDGKVWLRGPILRSEVNRTIKRLSRVKGVRELDGDLAVHDDASGIPSLQGGSSRHGERFELRQELWSPAARVFAGAAALGLLSYGILKRGPLGLGSGIAGSLLAARSLTNLPMRRLTGVGAGHRAVDLIKTIYIEAPVKEVYAFWRSFENFPRFMSHVKAIRHLGDSKYYWEVEGPAGRSFAWDAQITREIPNRRIDWKSSRDAVVRSAGSVRFESHDGGTRMQVHMSYNPPAGALGHEFLKLLGSDPRSEMHDDLLRFKSLIERGKATGREKTVTREELRP